MGTPLQTSFICPSLIGRDMYLDALPKVLDGVRRGEGTTLLISGEAGIGKSRMLRATREIAQARGFSIIQGHCFEHDSSLAYGPLIDALRSSLANDAPAAIRDALNASSSELARLLPELTSDGAKTGLDVSPAPDAEAEKRRLFQALMRSVFDVAGPVPLLLIFEDLHWSDALSLDFLAQLARHVPGKPLLLALSYRANEVQPPLRHLLAELDRARLATEWSLTPLDESQVEAMLRAIFGRSDAMRGDILGAVFTPTEGNPFFVEEMLKALVVGGDLVFADGTWSRRATAELRIPRSVQDAVQRRTGDLSTPAREALRIAAVVGQRFDFELLRTLTECDEGELLLLTKELITAQLVVELSAEQLAFRHALTRRAVYSELMARERRALHQRVATTLEHLYGQSSEEHLGELAYHMFEAGMWDEALIYAKRAGDQSLALYAPAAALDHFACAFAAGERLSRPADVSMLLSRGKAYEMLGEPARALQDNEAALEAARSAVDRRGEWRALNAIGFLWAARDYAKAGEFFQLALETAQSMGDDRLRAHSLNRRANWSVNTGEAAEGVSLHRDALELFQRLDDRLGIAQTYDLLGMANGIHGDAIGAVRSFDKAVTLLEQEHDTVNLVSSFTSRPAFGNPHLLQPVYSAHLTYDDCERDIIEARRLARVIGTRSVEAYVEFTASTTAFAFGRFSSGLAHGQESLHIAEETEHVQWAAAAHHALAYGYGVFLLAPEAQGSADRGLALAQVIGSAWWVGNSAASLAEALLISGKVDEADDVLRAHLALDRPPMNLPERRLWLTWGQLLLSRGEAASAIAVAEELIDSAPGHGEGQPIPWLLLLRGSALTVLGREDEAIPVLESALRGAQMRHEPHSEWRVRGALAALHLRCGRLVEAETEAARARTCIETLAATVDVSELRQRFEQAAIEYLPQRLRAAKAQTVGDEKAPRGAKGGLTHREREVATLVARGLANRAIADELVLSERTVESHVTNILGKLGFSSRAQIAAWAARQESSTPHTA